MTQRENIRQKEVELDQIEKDTNDRKAKIYEDQTNLKNAQKNRDQSKIDLERSISHKNEKSDEIQAIILTLKETEKELKKFQHEK